MTESFDLIINTDADPLCCAIAGMANGKNKYGFVIDNNGSPKPLSIATEKWFHLGVRDDLKRANRKSYQEIIYDIVGLKPPIKRPILSLRDDEINDAGKYLSSCGWKNEGRLVVGINTGAGGRWPHKALPVDTLSAVIDGLLNLKPQVDIFLLGGPEEREKNRGLGELFKGKVILTGTDNSIRRFAGIIYHSDVLLCADSLPMHIGIALNKWVIAHFGPTSPWEIGLYGYGEKIIPDMDCISCYLSRCDKSPACNEKVSPDELVSAIKRGIEKLQGGGQFY
jgi:ADP-heptose:LPS heptosyltransferase